MQNIMLIIIVIFTEIACSVQILLMQMSFVCELNIDRVRLGQRLGKLLHLPRKSLFSHKHLLKLMTPAYVNRSVHVPSFQEQK